MFVLLRHRRQRLLRLAVGRRDEVLVAVQDLQPPSSLLRKDPKPMSYFIAKI